jgi:dihydrofolate reductase
MTILSLIVAHADNRIIGKDNTMPWHLPDDLAYFKKTTLGKPVVMGRKTFQSIGRPLPGRQNIVISRDTTFNAKGIDTANSVEQALALAGDAAEVMVIGGGAIYQHCLASAERLYITHITANIAGDTQFPEYDTEHDWQKVSSLTQGANVSNAYPLEFCVYQRKTT